MTVGADDRLLVTAEPSGRKLLVTAKAPGGIFCPVELAAPVMTMLVLLTMTGRLVTAASWLMSDSSNTAAVDAGSDTAAAAAVLDPRVKSVGKSTTMVWMFSDAAAPVEDAEDVEDRAVCHEEDMSESAAVITAGADCWNSMETTEDEFELAIVPANAEESDLESLLADWC